MVSNTSGGSVTIADCVVEALSRDEHGCLQLDWAMPPRIAPHFWPEHEEDAKPFDRPIVLKSGEALFLTVNSLDLVEQFKLHSGISKAIHTSSEWQPTDNMQLSIEHSRSKNHVTSRFALEENEYQPT